MEQVSYIDELSRRQTRLFWTLALSCVLHVLLMVAGRPWMQPLPPPSSSAPIEITDVPQEWLKQAPKKAAPRPEAKIVESERTDNDKIDPNAKFLSEHNQSAEQEMRAKLVDDFRKKLGTGAKHGALNETPRTGDGSTAKDNAEKIADGEALENKDKGGVKRNWKSLSLKDLGIGGDGAPTAASDDKIEGVAIGDQTVLSTREFRYFSYYNRIKELLRQYWKPSIERKLAMIWARGKQLDEDEFVTKVLVLLDDHGNIKKISRLTSSGFPDLDEAATEAFYKAAPFPNPPKGIVDADGFVRVRWDFILQAVSGPRIQFAPAGVQ